MWYADNSDLASNFAKNKDCFSELYRMVTTILYHKEPSNSFLVNSTGNIDLSTSLFTEEGFKIDTGLRYLGGYLGVVKYAQDYMSDKVANWVKYVKVFYKVAEKEPQYDFSVITQSLHNKWSYTQRVTYHPVDTFAPLKHNLATSFQPAIFGGKLLQEYLLQITSLPVKMAGLGIILTIRNKR